MDVVERIGTILRGWNGGYIKEYNNIFGEIIGVGKEKIVEKK